MVKAAKIEFVCTDCGMNHSRWQGQCRCGAWNTLVEMKISKSANKGGVTRSANTGGYAGLTGGGSKKINQIEAIDAEKRLTGIGELDRFIWRCYHRIGKYHFGRSRRW